MTLGSARVSIVTPVYNASRYLTRTLESVLAQTFADWELVIVDDGSIDDSAEIAQTYADKDCRIRVFRQENRGGGAARNRGLNEARRSAEYVAFLDADDLYYPHTLETLVSALDVAPNAIAAAGLARYIDETDAVILEGEAQAWGLNRRTVRGLKSVRCLTDEPTSFATLAHWNTIHTPGQGLIRRSALTAIGSIDASLGAADYDMWFRLLVNGDILFINRVLLDYRRHSSAMSLNLSRTQQDDLTIQRKIFLSRDLSLSQIRSFVVARIYAGAYFRFTWTVEALRMRQPKAALHHLCHLLGSYLRLTSLVPLLVYHRVARHQQQRLVTNARSR
jgi:glycosyltransferase involved in cell wall biosynthesis